jgi:Lrp/AsnC family transcriptional regulator for asnA, asnC and gidA
MPLDELDQKIIRLLRENCIRPFVKIAKELDVTEGTIRQRVKKLVSGGVIKKFTVEVDAEALGLPVVAFIIASVKPGMMNQVVEQLTKVERVMEVHQIHTFGDILLKVRAPSLNVLGEMIATKIQAVEALTVNYVIPVLNVWKDSG